MNKTRRGKLLIDRRVQGAFVLRVIMYWVYCLITLAFLITCWVTFRETPQSSRELLLLVWSYAGPPAMASVMVLPLVVLDALRLTNRMVGPMYRMRNAMKRMADGQAVSPIVFRKGDFWYEFALEFNRLAERSQGDSAPGVAVDAAETDESQLVASAP